MESQLNRCEKIHKEYKELVNKTKLFVQDYIPGKELKLQHIEPKDIFKKEELRQKLLTECRDYLKTLKPEEKFEIENG